MDKRMKEPIWIHICRGCSAILLVVFMVVLVSAMALGWCARSAFCKDYQAVQGYMDMRTHSFEEAKPVALAGQWEYFPGMLLEDEDSIGRLGNAEGSWIDLPVSSLREASGPATYRLRFAVDKVAEDMAIYLQSANETYRVFLNGKLVWQGASHWSPNRFLFSRFNIPIEFDPDRPVQELVISANEAADQSLLYRNTPILGPSSMLVDYIGWSWGLALFTMGMVLVLLLNGLIFMILRTEYRPITLFAIFDTLLILRLMAGSPVTYELLHGIFGIAVSNEAMLNIQAGLLMLVGISGCILSSDILNKDQSISFKLTYLLCGLYGILAVCFGTGWLFYNSLFGRACLFAVFLGSMFLSVTQAVNRLRKECTRYYIFQSSKTAYIGIVLLIDILQLAGIFFSFSVVVNLYLIFFGVHLLVRLIDNNASYSDVARLNRDLETIVAARTAELTEANKALSELTTRDPLTRAYNRLYFEQLVEQKIKYYDQESFDLFLCIFDLDKFKAINDTYGHDVGDEQLVYFVKTIQGFLDNDMTLARIGGEEFVILIDHRTPEEAVELLERIRQRIEQDKEAGVARTTASFGMVRFTDAMGYKDFFKKADIYLYKAKRAGRNRVETDFVV